MITRRAGVLGALAVTGAMWAGVSTPIPAEAAEVQTFSFGGPRLGVQLEEVEADEIAGLGLSAPGGARVVDVREGSPAETAGVREGDVILEFDGESVRSVAHLARLVRETPPGREVSLELVRQGEKRSLSVAPAEVGLGDLLGEHLPQGLNLPERFAFDFDRPAGDGGHFAWRLLDDRPRLGIRYQDIEGQLADYFGLQQERGVLVVHVDEDSPAARAGVEAGDVVLELSDRSISDGSDLLRALRDVEAGDAVALRVLRRGQEQTLEVEPEERRRRPRRPHRRTESL